MKDILKEFEYLSDIPDKIDSFMEEVKHTRKHSEKKVLLKQAEELATAYNEHCKEGGNDKLQFNPIL